MNRYIVGTVVVFGQALWVCWDNRKNHLDAVKPGSQPHLAGPEADTYQRAMVEQDLAAGNVAQLNKLDGHHLEPADCVPVWLRHRHERAVAERLVTDAIAQGFQISVNDGEEWTLKRSTDVKEVMAALFTTDEDFIRIRKEGEAASIGQFALIYGNDGWDVIADWSYSTETEAQMEQIQRGAALLATAIETKYGW